jgi:arylsulfatase B
MKNRRNETSSVARALCAALGALVFPAAAAEKPNVLVIVADDLGFADVGFNGSTIPTPNLDRLASTGVNLTGFRAAPICSPTRAGLMTGRWPLRFGMMRAVVPPWSKYGLPAEEKTLPELLAPSGYDQRGLTGKWHLGHAKREFLPLANGFTSFYGHYNGALDYFTHERDGEVDWHRNDLTVKEPGYATDLIGAAAARFVREAPDKKPWLLYMPLNAPHSPMQAKEDDLAKFTGLGPKKKVYAAMVHAMDRAIGQVLTAVEARPDAADTLVLFFSDNGGIPKAGGNNGPYRGAKLNVYEGGTRSCAAMRWPAGGVTGGKRFDGRVGYIDVLPTLLAAAGAEAPKNLDGIDFLPAVREGKPLPERPWFSYIHQDAQAHASVHLGSWKLVSHGDFFAESPDAKVTWELYDLATDPAEAKDVAGQNPGKVAELRKLLREFGSWQKKGVGPYNEGKEGFKPPKDWIVTG